MISISQIVLVRCEDPNAPDGGSIIIQSGPQRRQQGLFSGLTVDEPLVSVEDGDFCFNGEVTVTLVDDDGTTHGSFTVSDRPEGPVSRIIESELLSFELYFEVFQSPRRVRDIATESPVCHMARNSWNCVVPPEAGLIFAPRYNKAWLMDGNANARVLANDQRRAYETALNALPREEINERWECQVTVQGQPHTFYVDRPRDADTFISGRDDLIRYWHLENQPDLIDNGINTNLKLNLTHRRHNGEGDTATYAQRLAQVLLCFDRYRDGNRRPLSIIAFFCHGWRDGFQLGISNMNSGRAFQNLVDRIKSVSREDVVIVLYACDTASADASGNHTTSFAAHLRDALVAPPNAKRYCRVVGHTETAHSYHTDDIMIFEGTDGQNASGHVITTDPTLRARLARRLGKHSPCPAFRWAFPLMSLESIREFLGIENPPADAFQMPQDSSG